MSLATIKDTVEAAVVTDTPIVKSWFATAKADVQAKWPTVRDFIVAHKKAVIVVLSLLVVWTAVHHFRKPRRALPPLPAIVETVAPKAIQQPALPPVRHHKQHSQVVKAPVYVAPAPAKCQFLFWQVNCQ